METRSATLTRRMLTRRCVVCGHDGPELASRHANDYCPNCFADLGERPPRSYAEMEGLLGQPITLDSPIEVRPQRAERMIHRWLLFVFFSMMGLVAIAYLSAEAFGI